MFWPILSGITAVTGERGSTRMTRTCFRFIAVLIPACFLLLGIWRCAGAVPACPPPLSGRRKRGRVTPRRSSLLRQRQPAPAETG
jgi:hypothetical protein